MRPAQTAMFGEMLLNVSSMAILDARDAGQSILSSGEKAQVRLRLTARAFIEANLGDPALDVAAVARFCRVSKRYLCSAFESMEEGAGVLIRELRLQKCRTDLRNPALRYFSVAQIATKWGFSSPSNFARAYRARFGCPPREDRH
jgi:AraC-like DNA-binding protein